MAAKIGGGHFLEPGRIKNVRQMRNMLCVDDNGRRATLIRCQQCDAPCGYGLRYLEMMGISYTGTGRRNGLPSEMLRPPRAKDLKSRLYAKGLLQPAGRK